MKTYTNLKKKLNGQREKAARTAVIPHFFDYQEERTNKKSSVSRPGFLKLNRKREIDANLHSDKANKDLDDSIATTNQPKKTFGG